MIELSQQVGSLILFLYTKEAFLNAVVFYSVFPDVRDCQENGAYRAHDRVNAPTFR